MKVFVDIDGVLLGPDRDKPHRFALADHALELLAFVVAKAELVFLSPHANGDVQPAIDQLVRHAKASDRERVLDLAAKAKPCRYRALRTEALPADGDFVWIDDEPTPEELEVLRARGWLDRWLWVDTREEPSDLLRAKQWLMKRLAPSAPSAAKSVGRPPGKPPGRPRSADA